MVRKKLLIICSDVIGARMAGPAIRCVEMATALSSDFWVTVAAPEIHDLHFDSFELIISSSGAVGKLAGEVDIIIFQGPALVKYPVLKTTGALLISDLYCPVSLEYHQSSGMVDPDLRIQTSIYVSNEVATQLCFADYFLCASERQRDFWLGALAISGRINGFRWPDAARADISDLISIVPFGISDVLPKKNGVGVREMFSIPEGEFVAIWGGGVYEWFDPLVIIRAIAELNSMGKKCHLVFVGIKHPNAGIGRHDMCSRAISLAESLGLMGKLVHFNFGWVDYSCRHNYLLDADVGVSAHFNNPETRFAFRTRILDYLWCGLPIICTRGDVFGEIINTENLGYSVEYEDVSGWIMAFEDLMSNKEKRAEFSMRSASYGKRYHWNKLTSNLKNKMNEMSICADRIHIRKNKKTSINNIGLFQKFRGVHARGGFELIIRYSIAKFFRTVGLR
jgi:glycosyltransferase involved in cell wall biosynthesis